MSQLITVTEKAAKKAKELLVKQKPDGGWSDLDSMESGAYATGKALYALQIAGLPAADPAYDRAVKLPKAGSETFFLNGYDAGREQNTERSTDIVDPCSALNPGFPLVGDPNGNRDAEVASSPAEPIRHHPGIAGIGDLSVANHGWTDPVAQVTVDRID